GRAHRARTRRRPPRPPRLRPHAGVRRPRRRRGDHRRHPLRRGGLD
ncbi:MAG: hypothetical protein AVDCRST_MAG40-700, partial [uncultured Gemmatimonadaceae bacterium]